MELQVKELIYEPNKYTGKILSSISENFHRDGFYGILGPNGSGKTTLIRHILGLQKVQKGNILLEGKKLSDYKSKELAAQISFVPQNTYLEADFTVYDIVAMGRSPYHSRFQVLTREDLQIIEEALEITNTVSFKEKKFNQLSGGEAQRVLVARAIAQDTPWLVLDEPISHLDIKHQVELMETLKKLNEKKKKTIIAILHDLNLTSAYCDHVVLMKKGEIYQSGITKDIMTRENLAAVYGIDFHIFSSPDFSQTFYIPCKMKEGDEMDDKDRADYMCSPMEGTVTAD